MSTRYLLPCPCGQSVSVSPSQAGGSVVCPSCETKVEVPRLRELRDLPPETGESGPAAAGWSFRLGVLSAGLFLAAGLASAAAWFAANEPPAPVEFDAAGRQKYVQKNLEVMTPEQLWDLHNDNYLRLAKLGLQKQQSPGTQARKAALNLNQAYQKILKYAAVAVAGLAVVAFGLLPK